jgi:RNA polymerase sigma-70 factor, ECF subfamily
LSTATPAAATEHLWRELHASVHRFVLRRVRRPEDADDITQRVFLNLHRSVDSLRAEDRVRAWIFRASRNAIADHYRAPAARREVAIGGSLDLEAASDAIDSGEDAVRSSEAELARCLRPLVDAMPAHEAEALRLVEIDGVSQAEASRRLGLSVSGMKSRVQRARARLRRDIEACCHVVLDRRQAIVDHQRKGTACSTCAPGGPDRLR